MLCGERKLRIGRLRGVICIASAISYVPSSSIVIKGMLNKGSVDVDEKISRRSRPTRNTEMFRAMADFKAIDTRRSYH